MFRREKTLVGLNWKVYNLQRVWDILKTIKGTFPYFSTILFYHNLLLKITNSYDLKTTSKLVPPYN